MNESSKNPVFRIQIIYTISLMLLLSALEQKFQCLFQHLSFWILHKPGLCFASILQLSPGSFTMSESGFLFSFRWERNNCPGVGMNFISPGYCPTTLPAHMPWWCIRQGSTACPSSQALPKIKHNYISAINLNI